MSARLGAILGLTLTLAGANAALAARSLALPSLPPCSLEVAKPSYRDGDPDPKRVLPIPMISSVDDRRRCDVSLMSVAVRDNGQLRDIYIDHGARRVPDDRSTLPSEPIPQQNRDFIDPVIAHLKAEIRAHATAVIGRLPAAASRAEVETALNADPVRLLIYAHGGLVSHQDAVLSAESLAPPMMRDGFVPLFLIWNNDLPVAYRDRLCCVRNGSSDPNAGFDMWFLIPARLVSDIGGSLAAAPANYFQEVVRYKESHDPDHDLYRLNYGDIGGQPGVTGDCLYFNPAAGPGAVCGNIRFPAFPGPGDDRFGARLKALLNGGAHNRRAVSDTLYFPLTAVRIVSTATLSQVGANAWDNMLRRTRLAFDSESVGRSGAPKGCEDEAGIVRVDEPLYCDNGGFTRFFAALEALLKRADGQDATLATVEVEAAPWGALGVPVTIEFYGHSMGAIVGDEILSRYPNLPWSKVVYMAAADTIRDFKSSTADAFAKPSSRPLEFHNLSLHPLNEAREKELAGAVPEGSLLEWIDEMFIGPKTADDRTLGKWKNLESTLPTWDPSVLAQVNVRVFPAQDDLRQSPDPAESGLFRAECDPHPAFGEPRRQPVICHPLKHGDFNHFSFWRPMYQLGAGAP